MLVAQIRRNDGHGLDAGALLAGVEDIAANDLESAWESGKGSGAAPPSAAAGHHAGRHGASGAGGGRDGAAPDAQAPFQYRYELRGHNGSVYMVAFAPSGHLIASGGFDKTVRVWDISRPARQEEVRCLAEHTLNVSDVAWSSDSATLLSGSYDQTVKAWNVASGQLLGSWAVSKGAFVQKVAFKPTSDAQLVLVATTHKHVIAFDRRLPPASAVSFSLENETMVNTLACDRDGVHLLTGDRNGVVKTWDLRTLKELERERVHNGEQGKPISHIEISAPLDGDGLDSATTREMQRMSGSALDDGRFVAVNSYDNVLRMYERAHPPGAGRPMELLHALKGHHNKNWPIRSSWYVGKNFRRSRPLPRRTTPHEGGGGGGERSDDGGGGGSRELGDPADERRAASAATAATCAAGSAAAGGSVGAGGAAAGGVLSEEAWGKQSVHDSMLLATGSADLYAYVFDVGGTRAKLVQRLEGHTDRVHAVSFHPQDPLLATCSADSTIKIWGAKTDRYRNG
ncbi:WD40-repeat-containing domain protein [Pavlovales sp. CCMP2436]|nr:WD40-repeat-containing domain protein [Pavlovales sp. CCMP2436]